MRRAAVTVPSASAEELRARFIELAPEGFEELEGEDAVVLTAYGPAAERVLAEFPDAATGEVGDDWAERWREFHRPLELGELWVGPPWLVAPAGKRAVIIDPGQAFGTGAHATTRLCLEFLLEQTRGSVLDVGCGSGVLAIAAAKLGFAPVAALDFDPIAVEVTVENARVNSVTIEVRLADAGDGALPPSDLALANISHAGITAVGPHLDCQRAITAGYLSADVVELAGFRRLERRERDGWAADLFERA